MNPEALIGTVLGTCTLQQVIGQGGMGAVFLAQQSRPRRQVAVKVLLPLTPLPPNQLAAFLERFRRETDAAASLEHPNIIPVYEYGEYNGLAYLVMPYISDGTLRDVMEREGALPLPKVVSYLEQLAAALDFAHERGVIHRDIKPANILLTPEGRVLLTDFGLVKISSDGQEVLRRLTGPGAPVGTPDYMSPEQVLGDQVDGRADLYSLGVILYQMVTGVTPFQAETPMQIAAQHLQIPPNPPRLLRPDLPIAAEQVMLRALEKRPADRYPRGQDLAVAFLAALISGSTQHAMPQDTGGTTGSLRVGQATHLHKPRGLFDPGWQIGAMAAAEPLAMTNVSPAPSTGLLSAYKTGKGTVPLPTASLMSNMMSPALNEALAPMPPGSLPTVTGARPALPSSGQTSPLVKTTTGALGIPNDVAPRFIEGGTANTIKLTGPVKVVQIPIAGQPGRYVTGLLPVPPQPQLATQATPGWSKRMMLVALAVAALLILGLGVGAIWFIGIHPSLTSQQQQAASPAVVGGPDTRATAVTQATDTAIANIILSDPLSQNIHNWPSSPTATANYVFTGGAYHITNLGDTGTAVILPAVSYTGPIGYTLTMQEIKGDDTSQNNSFGMIIRSSTHNQGGKTVTTFYSFEVVNIPGGEYRFYKYDDSQGPSGSVWTELWHQSFSSEFHEGHGLKSINTVKIFANGSSFTFTVNGKKVGQVQDRSFANGGVGMLVNLKGTEVAFSNMLITRN